MRRLLTSVSIDTYGMGAGAPSTCHPGCFLLRPLHELVYLTKMATNIVGEGRVGSSQLFYLVHLVQHKSRISSWEGGTSWLWERNKEGWPPIFWQQESIMAFSCSWISPCCASPGRALAFSPPGQLAVFSPRASSSPPDLMWEDTWRLPQCGVYPLRSYPLNFAVFGESCGFWRRDLSDIMRKLFYT